MTKLTHLDLSHNKIRDIADLAEISSRTVSVMDFSYNEIDYVPPEISQFRNGLRELYLNDNKLTYMPIDLFGLLQLKNADLRRNLFSLAEINAIRTRFQATYANSALLLLE